MLWIGVVRVTLSLPLHLPLTLTLKDSHLVRVIIPHPVEGLVDLGDSIYAYAYVHVCMCACVHVCMCIYSRCVYVCICVYV